MAKKIVLINQNAVLITGRLIPLLNSADVECASIGPDLDEAARWRDSADIFVLIAGNFVNDAEDFLVSLKDLCLAVGKPLCVMGYGGELEVIGQSIPKSMIAREFVRPIDINALADALKMMLNSGGSVEKKQILLVDDDGTFGLRDAADGRAENS